MCLESRVSVSTHFKKIKTSKIKLSPKYFLMFEPKIKNITSVLNIFSLNVLINFVLIKKNSVDEA